MGRALYSVHHGTLTCLLHSGGKLWSLVASGWAVSSGVTSSEGNVAALTLCLNSQAPCPSLFIVVRLLSCVRLSATPWTAAHQSFLSLTVSPSSPKFMSIASVMPSDHLIPCHPLLLCPQFFTASGTFPMSHLFASDDQNTGASASASALVLLVDIQGLSPLRLTGLISLLSIGLSRIFSSTLV